jgi:hypothetical protein
MRGLAQLARAAAQGAQRMKAVAPSMQSAAPAVLVTQLTSLRALQWQSAAAFSAYKRPPRDEDDDEAAQGAAAGRQGHRPRVRGPALLSRVPAEGLGEPAADAAGDAERQARIRALLSSGAAGQASAGASAFVDEFFAPTRRSPGSYLDMPPHLAAGPLPGAAGSGSDSDSDGEEDLAGGQFEFSTPEALDEDQEEELLSELKGLRKGSQR